MGTTGELHKELFKMNIKLVKVHPFYETFKDELRDILRKCLTYENKFIATNCFLSDKIDELERIMKGSGKYLH